MKILNLLYFQTSLIKKRFYFLYKNCFAFCTISYILWFYFYLLFLLGMILLFTVNLVLISCINASYKENCTLNQNQIVRDEIKCKPINITETECEGYCLSIYKPKFRTQNVYEVCRMCQPSKMSTKIVKLTCEEDAPVKFIKLTHFSECKCNGIECSK